MHDIRVEMADFKTAASPANLIATAVGSCVAVCLYDSPKKLGGLAHVMLPHSKDSKAFNPNRFANLAVVEMINQLEKLGAQREFLEAKIVGGANLFPFLLKNDEEQMGFRNVVAVKEILNEMAVRIVNEHVGGNLGRSVKFSLETGIVTVEIKI